MALLSLPCKLLVLALLKKITPPDTVKVGAAFVFCPCTSQYVIVLYDASLVN